MILKVLKYSLFLILSCFALESQATHNRAGEITYEHIGGLQYRITITTYTKQSAIADRPYLKIRWGDEPSNATEADLDSLARSGEFVDMANDLKRNIYVGTHIYAGAGTFRIVVEDPNRNSGVLNINNGTPGSSQADKTSTSVMAVFCIETVLVIRPGNNGHNNSVRLLKPPVQNACIFQPWIHNPSAFDEDGDELRFSLVSCLGSGAQPLQGWESPEAFTDTPNDSFTIDPQTGTISWLTPQVAGEYNIAILVEEFRNGIFVGSVLRDMQITVLNCNNIPPIVQAINDTCITAGTLLTLNINFSDPNNNTVNVTAFGGPLTQVVHTASWSTQNNQFNWAPKCEEIRAQPYLVTFEATDNGNVPLTGIETVQIRVVAPPVTNTIATAGSNQIVLTWNPHSCNPIFTPQQAAQVRYKIYRRGSAYGFTPANCELGVPAYTGYSFIGQVSGIFNTTYTDTDVNYGGEYCYMVVTCWPDGAESYASAEFCAKVTKDVPVMTKVSVVQTSITAGIDSIMWSKPTDLDVTLFPGPYRYRLYHTSGNGQPNQLIHVGTSFTDLASGDTAFVFDNHNTLTVPNTYRAVIYSESLDQEIASSSRASSVFLTLLPDDNSITLMMDAQVPWSNFRYRIYRRGPGESEFSFLDQSDDPVYTDLNLVNNQDYCYKVEVLGSYFADDVPDPLFNWSQETCAKPYDKTPPCPPVLSVTGDCEQVLNFLEWNNPNNTCADDVTAYHVYYTPVEGGEFTRIASISSANTITYTFEDTELPLSIAGCFAVTAIDSLNLWPDGNFYRNESAFSNIVCVDNCPYYELPNIFSPNNDGKNDFFTPIRWRYVESIDLKIFNRWGKVVFEATDPTIMWDGKNKDSGSLSTDGVYYYTIRVNTIRLRGIVPEDYSGTIHLIDGTPGSNTN